MLVERPRDVDGLAAYYRQHRLAGLVTAAGAVVAAFFWALAALLGVAGPFEVRVLVAGFAPCGFLLTAGMAWRSVAAPWLQARAARRMPD